jgi:hypothetical protein
METNIDSIQKQGELIGYKLCELDDSHHKSENVPELKIALMNHQKTSIYHAEMIERNEGIRVEYSEPEYSAFYSRDEDIDKYRNIYFNFGIIACKVGSGKSFVALAIIIRNPLLNFNRMVGSHYNSNCFSFKKVNTTNYTVSTNIILVPHNLFHQWQEYLTKMTSLDVIYISSKITFDKFALSASNVENFEGLTMNKVYLISAKQWNNFAEVWNTNIKKKVSRIFVDEVHSINLPNSIRIKTNFLWFITSSVNDISNHRNYGFIRDTIDNYNILNGQFINFMKIKNKDNYIDSSLQLLPSRERIIKCRSSIILNIFEGIINQEVKDMLLAEDIQGVVNYLGITSINNQDIVNVICSNMEKDLENAKLMYRAKEQMHYLNEQAKTESLQKAQEKITAIEGKISGVKQRIVESNIDPIMFMEIENPVITACCNNKFDLESITNYYDFQLKQTGRSFGINCPLCRKPLDLKKLMYIGESKMSKMELGRGGAAASWVSEEHTKIENLEKILCNEIDKDKRILIFSEHEGNFDCYSKAFAKSGRNNLSAVKGSICHITNLLGKFNSGEIPCLFLNAKYCGSGLNLEKTDVVIIMHKMTQDNIKQVIGRAQRIGRQGQLEVYFLYAENE